MKKGFPQRKLADVIFDIKDGGTPSRKNLEYFGGDVCWCVVKDIKPLIFDTAEKLTQEGLNNCSAKVWPVDSVIISLGATIGQIGIAKVPTATKQGLAGIVLNKQMMTPEFLCYGLLGQKEYIQSLATGATIKEIRPTRFAETIQIPVPPLAEQQRIVGLLDEAFEGLATAKANAEKNLQNARALFESHLHSVLTRRGPGWVDRTLDQVCIVERGSSPRPINEYFTTKPDGVNWIKIGDTEEGGKYVHTTAQKITPEGAKQSRFVKEGDLILTNSMSYGRPYIMKTSGYIHDGWFVLRLNIAIDTNYFYYLLASPVVQLQFASLASGSVVKNISGDLVKKAVLPIPPLEHQHIIVEKLLAMSEKTQRLASIYQRKLAALEALKKSLLHQAFAGSL